MRAFSSKRQSACRKPLTEPSELLPSPDLLIIALHKVRPIKSFCFMARGRREVSFVQDAVSHADLPAELGGEANPKGTLDKPHLQAQSAASQAGLDSREMQFTAHEQASMSQQGLTDLDKQASDRAREHIIAAVNAAQQMTQPTPVANSSLGSGAFLRVDLTKIQAHPTQHAGVAPGEWRQRQEEVVKACKVDLHYLEQNPDQTCRHVRPEHSFLSINLL